MHKLFGKIKKLRTNENILIAVNVLFNSKSSFMGIFLMSFMISVSLKSSPMSYLAYELSAYAFCGILCVILSDILRSHPVNSWRASMFFSIVRILAVITIDPNFIFFPIVIGFLGGLESQLYWRPKDFLEIREVSNARRDRFNNIHMILVEITKIVMPIVLGIAISDEGYERAAIIVLIISIVQFSLSFLLRPSKKIEVEARSLRESLHFAVAHKRVRQTLWMQALRGMILTGCAYEIVTQLNIYQSDNSNVELGGFQSSASVIAIILLLLYRRIKKKNLAAGQAMVYALLPAIVLLPISAIIFPGNFLIAIVLYIYYRAVVHPLFSNSVFDVYYKDELKKAIHDDAYRIQIDILGELWLCIGRVISIIPIFIFIGLERQDLVLPTIIVQSIIAPIIIIAIRKFETSPALDKH